MSFFLRQVEPERWSVINDGDVPVFTGSLRECEDWLDAWENTNKPRRSLVGRLFAPILRLFGSRPTIEPTGEPIPPAPPARQKPADASPGRSSAEHAEVAPTHML